MVFRNSVRFFRLDLDRIDFAMVFTRLPLVDVKQLFRAGSVVVLIQLFSFWLLSFSDASGDFDENRVGSFVNLGGEM